MENKKIFQPLMNYYLQTFCYNHRLKELSEQTGQKWNNPNKYDAGFKLGLGAFKFTQGYDCKFS
jgi:hypothetical protein